MFSTVLVHKDVMLESKDTLERRIVSEQLGVFRKGPRLRDKQVSLEETYDRELWNRRE